MSGSGVWDVHFQDLIATGYGVVEPLQLGSPDKVWVAVSLHTLMEVEANRKT